MEKAKIDNILIVDDQPSNIRVLSTMLNHQDYKVRKALNGEAAITAVCTEPPDLILLDIKMPEMDGYQVCKQLKSQDESEDIPIIFISALQDAGDKVKAFEVGGIDYITKPFQQEEVLARIRNQLIIKKQQQLLSKEKKLLARNQDLLISKQKKLEQEIKQRKEAEATLSKSRSLIASILMTSLDGIAAFEAIRNNHTQEIENFSCLVANPIIAKMLNKKLPDITTQLFFRKFIQQFAPNLFSFSAFVDVVETGKSLEKDFTYQCEQGEKWYHLVAVKLDDGLALTIRDITETKKSEIELNYLATMDGLTGLSNRRIFDQRILEAWQICQREKQALSLILCDVDYFKQYNDYYGHQAGDNCLKKIAQSLNKVTKRPADLVARYGGEEFAIILPNTHNHGAVKVGKNIIAAIEKLQLPHVTSRVSNHITLSLGIATVTPSQTSKPTNLIRQADEKLYEAKETGRNRLAAINIINN